MHILDTPVLRNTDRFLLVAPLTGGYTGIPFLCRARVEALIEACRQRKGAPSTRHAAIISIKNFLCIIL